jgi:predicted transcriptional regulator
MIYIGHEPYNENEDASHIGVKYRSGRYPYGSGEDPYQHDSKFLSEYARLQEKGLSETDIAKGMGMSTTELRERKSLEINDKKAYDNAYILKLHDKGYSNVAIAERMGISEGKVRTVLKAPLTERRDKTQEVADILRENVDSKGYIDVGKGVNLNAHLNSTETRMKTAIRSLQDEGYVLHQIKVKQPGTGDYTTMKILCPPGTTFEELNENRDKIHTIDDTYTVNENTGKLTLYNIHPPVSVDPNRISVRYAEDGGKDMDGVIQLRPGVDDISLGNAKYAQVRILVDDSHYLKGMAMYSNDIPDGKDIVFNTNKHKGTPLLVKGDDKASQVLKPITDDPDNPFGAVIKKQPDFIDISGKQKQSAINIVNEEGDWGEWSKSLASQFLSKQPRDLVKKQLDLSYADKKEEFDAINKITVPALKKKLLQEYADECDSAAVTLKAAALPRQASKVILPIPNMKNNEVYAPTYENGEEVILVRYPHGGTFEIPRLTVNNNQATAKKVMKNASDAIGINAKVAEQLSGADFDGDTVLVIPTKNIKVRTRNYLEELKNFDPKEAYPERPGMKYLDKKHKGMEMGKVTNLINDMTIQGAPDDEIVRAIKHSMVVIDAPKHKLDYKRSEKENNIAELREIYQKKDNGRSGGASTLISRAKSPVYVNQRSKTILVDPETGEKIFKETGNTTTNKKGERVKRQTKSTQMYETKDAYSLSSGTEIENLYANYANQLKALSNKARKESISVKSKPINSSAQKTYSEEVESLKSKLRTAQMNKPKERQALLITESVMKMKRAENPDMDKEEYKKKELQALSAARARVGANKKKVQVNITDREWEAILAEAVPSTTLKDIFDNTDSDALKKRAMPRETKTISSSTKALAKRMADSGFTQADIADRTGLSTSTISDILAGKK